MTEETENKIRFWFKIVAEIGLFVAMQVFLAWQSLKH